MAILGAGGLFRSLTSGNAAEAAGGERFPVSKPAAEWREQLTPEQYHVLREHGTERAGTSPLNAEKRPGLYHCAGCDLAPAAWRRPTQPAHRLSPRASTGA